MCEPGYTGDSESGCRACAENTFKLVTGSDACIACEPGTFSLTAAVSCDVCKSGFRGLGCYIRDPSTAGATEFMVQLSLTVHNNATIGSEAGLRGDLIGKLSDFFSTRPGQVQIEELISQPARRSSATLLGLTADVVLVDSREEFVGNSSFIKSNLEGFLRAVHPSFKVSSMTVTCGQGYSFNSSLDNACVPCKAGFFQPAANNSECQACMSGMTSRVAATSVEECSCEAGLVLSSGRCISAGQVVSPEAAAEAAAVVSAVVGATVAASVAAGVAAGVAGAAGGAAGGGAAGGGAAGGGAGGGPAMALIGHVQMVNVVGRVGGSNGSTTMAAFGDGLGWANLDLPFSMVGADASRRHASWRRRRVSSSSSLRTASTSKSGEKSDEQAVDGAAEDTGSALPESEECSFQAVAPPLDKLLVCLVLLISIFCLRSLLVLIIERCMKKSAPTALLFPLWEGPCFLLQYLAMCDSVFSAMHTYCPLGVTMGSTVLIFGPLLFMTVVLVRLRPYLDQNGHELFEKSEPLPGIGEMAKSMYNTKGILARYKLLS